ncbi:MAG: hypothetical protein KDI55_19155, partial [Anaerolineae bacterium]|nr:hypothetical protein [Anaerolineae bacterium]
QDEQQADHVFLHVVGVSLNTAEVRNGTGKCATVSEVLHTPSIEQTVVPVKRDFEDSAESV